MKFGHRRYRVAILLDTGALELIRRRSREVETLVVRHFPPLICSHVAAEFLYGQILANVSSQALLQAQEFLDSFEMLCPGKATTAIYARLRASLKAAGHVLPDPDYWIAAHALEEHVPLISTDRHFSRIPDLDLHLIAI